MNIHNPHCKQFCLIILLSAYFMYLKVLSSWKCKVSKWNALMLKVKLILWFNINREALAKQGDDALGSFCLSVRLSVLSCLNYPGGLSKTWKWQVYKKLSVCLWSVGISCKRQRPVVGRLLIFYVVICLFLYFYVLWLSKCHTWGSVSCQVSPSFLHMYNCGCSINGG